MSDVDSASSRPRPTDGKPSRLVWWIILAGLAVLAVVGMLIMQGDEDTDDPVIDGATSERLELTRTALAATENLEMAEADQSWSALFQQTPQNRSVALNRAINRVLRVDQLTAQATNAALDAAEKRAARQQLPGQIAAARQAIEEYAEVAESRVIPIWLRARVDLHEASLLPGALTRSRRREVYQRLSEAIRGEAGKRGESIILGGTLIDVVEQLEDPIDGLPGDLLQSATETVGTLSDQHPDNLFFALRAARFRIDTQSEQAAKYVKRASQLAEAIEPSIRRETEPIGVTPDELVQQIIEAIERGDWSEADTRMLLWFNVLNSTEIVKTDRRLANPHPLDRLSFESLRVLSAKVAEVDPLIASSEELTFQQSVLPESEDSVAIATIDFEIDLDPDLVSIDREGNVRLWLNERSSENEATTWTLAGRVASEIQATGLLMADLFVVDSSDPRRLRARTTAGEGQSSDYAATVRHDTLQTIVAYGTNGVRMIIADGRREQTGDNPLSLVEEPTGLEDLRGVLAAVAGDLEADGDIDLVFATENDGIRLFANRGNRTFFEIQPGTGEFSTADPVVDLAIADLDRDLDLDIVTVQRESHRVGLLENLLHLQFRGRILEEVPAVAGASSVRVEDIDGNVSWDLVVAGQQETLIAFSQTAAAGAWTVENVVRSDQGATPIVIADFDNDSFLDAVDLNVETSLRTPLGPWGFGLASLGETTWTELPNVTGERSAITADFNRDGKVDIATVIGGQVAVAFNQTDSAGHFVNARFRGIDDNASGRVNHYAIGSTLELRFGPHYRARIITSPQTHFGIDGFEQADTIRAILPNGLTQTIREPGIDSLVEEEQTLKGSCPYLYAWNGEKFVFKTDCLWAAPLGLQVARGVVAKDRPWEYLMIDGSDVQPRDGHYEFRITEELWEVAYFDKVALRVVDHPADVEVWTNEKVGPAEIAEPTLFAFERENLYAASAAIDTTGKDVTQRLAESDRHFVQGFDRRLRQGLCPPHWIDLDFHDALDRLESSTREDSDDQDAAIYLVLTGWILPTDTSLNIQIDQNPELGPIEFPSVWVPEEKNSSRWRKAIPFMGFPGGKTKTIVVDVSDVIRRDDPRIRVRTSAQIYWDRALLAVQPQAVSVVQHDQQLVSAELGYHGYSAKLLRDSTQPERYDYQQATVEPKWPPLRGTLTRVGPCTELLQRWDDQMVVMGSGDEIRLRFTIPEQPLPAGWRRDFVLHSVGWDKDADLNTLSGQQTGPLPHRMMKQYPPAAGDTDTTMRLQHLNQSHLQRHQSFRAFWFRTNSNRERRFLSKSSAAYRAQGAGD